MTDEVEQAIERIADGLAKRDSDDSWYCELCYGTDDEDREGPIVHTRSCPLSIVVRALEEG